MAKIQILGLRAYTKVHKDGTSHPAMAEKFFNHNWRLDKLSDVFSPMPPPLDIPEAERFNLHFTIANCLEERGRQMLYQDAIPFDVDGVEDEAFAPLIVEAFRDTLQKYHDIRHNNLAVTWSGHGVHIFYFLNEAIKEDGFFDSHREAYKDFCQLFQGILQLRSLPGKVDSAVFAPKHLMRFPGTLNKKAGKEDREAYIVECYGGETGENFLIPKAESTGNYITKNSVNIQALDSFGIQKECEFLIHCKLNQNSIGEPEWYAMIGVVSWLEDGRRLAHDYSREHAQYTEHETEVKINQALRMQGPRKCKSIDALWGKCSGCKHFGNIKSPVQIETEGFVKTEHTGFRRMIFDKNGLPKEGALELKDLIKVFIREYNYRVQILSTVEESSVLWKYSEAHWQRLSVPEVNVWVEKKTKGNVRASEVAEFVSKLKRNQEVYSDFETESATRYKQFSNCVIDMVTGEALAPSPDLWVTNILPHIYDKEKTSPTWDKFLVDITEGDEDKIRILNEYAGFILFSGVNWIHKALILVGDGANGKSVYIDVVRELAGVANSASIPLEKLGHEYSVAMLENKILNVCGETSHRALSDSSVFKGMIAGEHFQGRNIYEHGRMIRIRAKFVVVCNEIPKSYDQSFGIYRRQLVINLQKRFEPGTPGFDPFIASKLKAELPGIINTAFAAYKDLQKRGMFLETEHTLREKDKFMRDSNAVSNFVAEFFKKGNADEYVLSQAAMDMALEHAAQENIDGKQFTAKTLFNEAKRRFGAVGKCKRINGKVLRAYFGVVLKTDEELIDE